MFESITVTEFPSSINGVKEVRGFRQTFNISYTTVIVSSSLSQKNDTATATQCSSEDDVETSALLVPTNNIMHV